MIKLERTVIVEGKYDKIKLSNLIDAHIIQTDGFSIFKDKEKQKLIRRLAAKNGLLILTDSDAAGFKIRSFLGGIVPPEQIRHAYIPDIYGKEKRKAEASKEGKLGVEGIEGRLILEALEKAGVICEETESTSLRREITKTDLFEDGFAGGKNSAEKRKVLLKALDFPERMSANAMLSALNIFLSFEEYKALAKKIREGAE